ncbi:hypothetical protein [Empedobacter brevis]|uniref:hypothetical protein n=1 Tax=Empedobacter brevis TaxID=247 RepID=UPI002FE13A19
MKKIATLLFTIYISASFAQKKFDDNNNVVFYETIDKKEQTDKLTNKGYTYKTGHPVFIVLNIQASIPNDDFLAKREQEELKNNFNIHVDCITQTTEIKFLNRFKTVLKYSYEDSPQKVIYWSGKFEEKPIIYEHPIQSSEYFSDILNLDVRSSYIEEFNQKLASFTTDFIDTPTENSLPVSNRFVQNVITQILYHLQEESIFFNLNFKNVKRVTYNTNFDIDNDRLKEILFDEKGRPTKVVFDDLNDKNYRYESVFEYEKDLIRNIIGKSTNDYHTESPVFYQDDTLYVYDSYSIKIYKLNKNLFLISDDYFYDQEKYYFTVNQTFLNNTTYSFIENDHMNDRVYNFNSEKQFFPIKVKIRDDINGEIKRINDKLYIETGYEADTHYHFDENNRIIRIVYKPKDASHKDRIIDYLYEYYN